MSLLQADAIKIIAESVGISSLKEEVAVAIAQDIEYRLRDIIQEAMKFMRHAKRSKLTTEDIHYAMKVRNIEKLYGFNGTSSSVQFKTVQHSNFGSLFYVDEDEIDFDDILSAPLPKVPLPVTFTTHWLAVEGVQPTIPQNPAPIETKIESLSRRLKSEGKYDFLERKTEIKPLVRHVLSKELQLYFEKIVESLNHHSFELRSAALENIKEDQGIQQLLPYFIQYVTEQISTNLRNIGVLNTMMMTIYCILKNPHFFLEPYLHQLMPPILTCIVSKRLCEKPEENHWSLREFAADLLSEIITKHGDAYQTLQPRVTRTLLRAFLDPLKALSTHYGAIIGLSSLGVEVIKVLILPNLKAYYHLILPILKNQEDSIRYQEAQKCMKALKNASLKYLRSEWEKAQKKKEDEDEDEDQDDVEMDVAVPVQWETVVFYDVISEIFGADIQKQIDQ